MRSERRDALAGHLAFVLVLAVASVGFVQISFQHWRQGTTVLGVALVLAAALRAVLPEQRTGLLAIRGRAVDVACYTAFGLVVAVVALTITGGPLSSR